MLYLRQFNRDLRIRTSISAFYPHPHSNSLPRGERTMLPLPEGEGWGEG